MTTLFDSEERQELRDSTDTEFTLSTASILGIFFGLVLICGVFFGFGYSMGRRSDDAKASATAATPSTADQLAVATAKAKPSAVQTLQSQPVSAPSADYSSAAPDSPSEAATSAVVHTRPVVTSEPGQKPATVQKAALDTTAAPKAAVKTVPAPAVASAPTTATPPPAAAGPSMVQIAAVSHQEDAAILISALKKRGYDVVIRNEPQDKLLHVQIGPFATRAEAATMKQKLLADGYNAIIK